MQCPPLQALGHTASQPQELSDSDPLGASPPHHPQAPSKRARLASPASGGEQRLDSTLAANKPFSEGIPSKASSPKPTVSVSDTTTERVLLSQLRAKLEDAAWNVCCVVGSSTREAQLERHMAIKALSDAPAAASEWLSRRAVVRDVDEREDEANGGGTGGSAPFLASMASTTSMKSLGREALRPSEAIAGA